MDSSIVRKRQKIQKENNRIHRLHIQTNRTIKLRANKSISRLRQL